MSAVRWAQLVFRLHRSELVALGWALLLWAAVTVISGIELLIVTNQHPSCFGLATANGPDCQVVGQQVLIWERAATMLMWLTLPASVFLGIVLGVPIIAREVELRTAQLSWSLATDRTRWLVLRVYPILLIALIVLAVLATSAEALGWIRVAGDDQGLVRYDQRGPLVVFRGIAALAVAVLAAAWLGRTLSSILLAMAIAAVLIGAVTLGMDAWRRAEADVVKLDVLTPGSAYLNGLTLGPVSRLPDGTFTNERNLENLPPGTDFDWWLMLPGDTYWTWIARESAIYAVTTIGIGALATLRLSRRRPI